MAPASRRRARVLSHGPGPRWATCPITENGFLRILGHANDRSGPGSPQAARTLLAALCASPGHQFWPGGATLRDTRRIGDLPASGRLTDAYLLALAVERRAKLATFDQRIDPAWVVGGAKALMVLAHA